MSRQLGRYYYSKCRFCGVLFVNDRQGVDFVLCEKCRAPAIHVTSAAPDTHVPVVTRTLANGTVVETRGTCPIAPWPSAIVRMSHS